MRTLPPKSAPPALAIAIAAAGLLASGTGPAFALAGSAALNDVPPNGAQATAIRTVVAQGLMSPVAAGKFAPGAPATRADLAVAMQRMFALPPPAHPVPFADVPPSSPYYAAAEAVAPYLHRQALCPGCMLTSNFAPNAAVSKAQAEIALTSILSAKGNLHLLSQQQANTVLANVRDAAAIPHAARPYLATAISNGILPLTELRAVQPAQRPTRGQFAALLYMTQRSRNITVPGSSVR